MPPALVITLGEKIASISLAQLRQVYGKRAWMKNCARQACGQTDAPYAWRPVARWLGNADTWDLLRRPGAEMEAALVASLQSALHPRLAVRRRQWATERRRELARRLVPLIADSLLRYAPVNLALDKLAGDIGHLQRGVDEIASDVHTVLGLLDTDQWDQVLASLPLGVRLRLIDLDGQAPVIARELGRRLREGRTSPNECLRTLTQPAPTFLQSAPSVYILVMAEWAAAYNCRAQAQTLFMQAATDGLEPARSWTRAAMIANDLEDSPRARELLALALSAEPDDHLATVALAGMDDDIARVQPHVAALAAGASSDPLGGLVASRAHRVLGNRIAAIATLRALVDPFPDHTSACLELARVLQQEAALGPQLDRTRLLSEALELAVRARDERRRVQTDSSEAVVVAAEILLLLDRESEAVAVCLSPKHEGSATPVEGADPHVRAMAIEAALDANNIALVRTLLDEPGELANPPLVQARLALQSIVGTPDDCARILLEAYDPAAHISERLPFLEILALAGAPALPDIDEVKQVDPATADRLIATSEIERGQYDDAIQRLRAHRPYPHSHFPRLVARAYERKGEVESAIIELQQAASQLLDPTLRMRAAVLLADLGRTAEAASEGEAVLAEMPPESVTWTAAQRWLLELAWKETRWDAVERHARALLARDPTETDAAWALIGALHNSGRDDLAWAEYQRYHPPIEPANAAAGWLHIASAIAQPEDWVPRALELATTFADDLEVSKAFLNTSAFIPQDANLNADIWQAIRDRNAVILERHGQRIGFRQVSIDELPGLIEDMAPGLKAEAERVHAVLSFVRQRGAPIGFLAQAIQQPYAEVLLRRGAGCIQAVSPIGNSRDVASAALGKDVVVDTSALTVATELGDLYGELTRRFRRLFFTQAQRLDLAMTQTSLRAPTAAGYGWDRIHGQVALTIVDQEELQRLRARAAVLSSRANAFALDTQSGIPDFAGLGEAAGPWVSGAQAAIRRGVSLWADDLGLRMIAAERGVSSFGTLDVLLALHANRSIGDDKLNEAVLALARCGVVDLPLTDAAIMHLAREDQWSADSGALPFSRVAFWADAPRAARLFSAIVGSAALVADATLGGWVCAAATGFASTVERSSAPMAIGRVLTTALLLNNIQPNHVPELVAGARLAAQQLGIDDPLGVTVKEFHALAVQRFGPAQGAAYVMQLMGGLEEGDREIVRTAVFG